MIAFIPGDPLLAAALEHDPSLLDHAVEHRVILATPTILIALLRTIAFGWQQESLARTRSRCKRPGASSTSGFHVRGSSRQGRAGASEARSTSYNKAVGSLERNVLPQARRFNDLGVGVSDQPMPERRADRLRCHGCSRRPSCVAGGQVSPRRAVRGGRAGKPGPDAPLGRYRGDQLTSR